MTKEPGTQGQQLSHHMSHQPRLTEVMPTTSALNCRSAKVPVLLQTARAMVFKVNDPQRKVEARIMLDSGSQRSYITKEVAYGLSLAPKCSETMIIKTFGSQSEVKQVCDVVSLLKNGRNMQLSFLTVPFICEPLSSQPTAYASEHYPHLAGWSWQTMLLSKTLSVSTSSDNYWRLVTGDIISADVGPTAVRTNLGVLADPVEGVSSHTCSNLVVTYALTRAPRHRPRIR